MRAQGREGPPTYSTKQQRIIPAHPSIPAIRGSDLTFQQHMYYINNQAQLRRPSESAQNIAASRVSATFQRITTTEYRTRPTGGNSGR